MNNKKIIICVIAVVIAIVLAIIVISVVANNVESKSEEINNEFGIVVESDESETPIVNMNTNNSSIKEIDEETLSQYN